MESSPERFRVRRGHAVDLAQTPTRVEPIYASKKHYHQLLAGHAKQMGALQNRLYASNTHSLLVVFQGMDASGKDGTIQRVLFGVNPHGLLVNSFKHPSEREHEHDFLWRIVQRLPERGQIGIFNRSHYEEVLIVRVHPELLRAEGVPDEASDPVTVWDQRYESIRHLEEHLHRNGTRVLKLFLHISKEEQRKRFLARLDEPAKNWKFSSDDLRETERWDDYMTAYAQCFKETSTDDAPWYAIPADDKRNARLFAAELIVHALESIDPQFPALSEEHERELASLREQLGK